VEEFKRVVQERYGTVPDHVARELLRRSDFKQLFALGADAREEGKVATTGPKDHWMVDIVSLKNRTPTNDPNKYLMLAQNVYSGYLLAEPMSVPRATGPDGTAALFRKMLADARAANEGPPKSITTDDSKAEWLGEFEEELKHQRIIRRIKQPEDRNAMGKIDATIGRVKKLLFHGLADRARRSWSGSLADEVKKYNEVLHHEGSFGSKITDIRGPAPDQVREDNVLDFQIMRHNARAMKHNTKLTQKRQDDVMGMGAFRYGLGYWKSKFDVGTRAFAMKWSKELHRLASEDGPWLVDEDGERYNAKMVDPVPPESKNVKLPKFLQESGKKLRDEKRAQLYPWARKIHDYMQTYAPPKYRKDTVRGVAALVLTDAFKNRPGFRDPVTGEDVPSFREAIKKAKLGALGLREVETKPVAIMGFFKNYFRQQGSQQLWEAVGAMPERFDPDDEEDSDDEDYMEGAEEVPLPGAEMVPQFRSRAKRQADLVERSKRELQPHLGDLHRWLSAQKGQQAPAAEVMRWLRARPKFRDLLRLDPRLSRAENVVFAADNLDMKRGNTPFNPRIRAVMERPAPDDFPAPVANMDDVDRVIYDLNEELRAETKTVAEIQAMVDRAEAAGDSYSDGGRQFLTRTGTLQDLISRLKGLIQLYGGAAPRTPRGDATP